MTAVDRVKEICKNKGIPIYRLESDLGFSNGYLRKLTKGTFPDDRLRMIADYLNLPTEYIMTGVFKDERFDIDNAELLIKIRKEEGLTDALKMFFELSDEQKRYAMDTIKMLSSR